MQMEVYLRFIHRTFCFGIFITIWYEGFPPGRFLIYFKSIWIHRKPSEVLIVLALSHYASQDLYLRGSGLSCFIIWILGLCSNEVPAWAFNQDPSAQRSLTAKPNAARLPPSALARSSLPIGPSARLTSMRSRIAGTQYVKMVTGHGDWIAVGIDLVFYISVGSFLIILGEEGGPNLLRQKLSKLGLIEETAGWHR